MTDDLSRFVRRARDRKGQLKPSWRVIKGQEGRPSTPSDVRRIAAMLNADDPTFPSGKGRDQ